MGAGVTDPIETTPLPALAGFGPGGSAIKIVRPLTPEDLSQLDAGATVHRLAAPIMQMFGILTLNHGALADFAAELADPGAGFRDPSMQLNRHVLNYLASANALLGHFGVTFKKRCREVGNPDTGFDDFCRKLKAENDDFEFFCELRNHALHVGLPVGNISVAQHLHKGRSISIFHKTSSLIRDGSRDLKRCRLLSALDEIELLPHLECFHQVFMKDVFRFIVDCLMPGLEPSSRFHARLTAEVKALGADLRPVIMTGRTKHGSEFQWAFDWLPEDVFQELGISIERKPRDTAPEPDCSGSSD